MTGKRVYAFGAGSTDSEGLGKDLLGGKGFGLAEMSRLGIPVPPGFTITTEVCNAYNERGGKYPQGLAEEVASHVAQLEGTLGQKFGDPADPLLVSVRSGAPLSMPGMMDTILNLGLNDELVDAQSKIPGFDTRSLLDAYRRLIAMYSNIVMDLPRPPFEAALTAARGKQGVATDAELSRESLSEICCKFMGIVGEAGKTFPQDPKEQLWGAITAVFESWNGDRAKAYRKINGISDKLGTAVNVQAMVFGNRGTDCATGVAFTRNPATGEGRIYGEFLTNAQGEDVVAGIRTPQTIETTPDSPGLAADFPDAARELEAVAKRLEAHFRDMQDLEFTIQHGKLFMLQTRTGKRTGSAAVRIAAEMVGEGVIDSAEALKRVEPQHLEQMLAPVFDLDQKKAAVADHRLLAKGLPAGPGAATGRIALTAEKAAAMAAEPQSKPIILVRAETSPEDIVGMHVAVDILTSRGGMTSHAAVVARGMGKPCVVGAGDLSVDETDGIRVGDRHLAEGDEISIDGTTGEVIAGRLESVPSAVLEGLRSGRSDEPGAKAFVEILAWADQVRRLKVRANADTPTDAEAARLFGAQGIGLCRTEHMFFDEERIPWVRRMILANDEAERKESLARLLPMQQSDFEGIFAALPGLPITIRLLDPPLHEFLPHGEKAIRALAEQMGVAPEAVEAKAEQLHESNPMLGHRGCRLGLTAPDIYDMQVEGIVRAACVRAKAGEKVRPEIMVPLVGSVTEMIALRQRILAVRDRILAAEGLAIEILVGTMIEVPRAALVAGQIAEHADFFSFGTNDLTQMTFGFSRDDVGSFLPRYLEDGILEEDPFASIDEEGVGQLVRMACEQGRASNAQLHLGVCGEHGGDPRSVHFFDRVGLDYVSCSPYRVPIARLAAARARLGVGSGGKDTS